ncbi:hypothetical protein A9Q77_05515 [Marinomonas sp. 42_23_T18]|nr:hypothetical protein A9Q77_05515 [Marinomonas sp. 42_23_T18]
MKIRVLLSFWFVLLLLLSGLVLSPLHLWRVSLNQFLSEEGVQLDQFEGRLWQGKMSIRGDELKGNIQLQWRASGLFEPIDFQLVHKDIKAWGKVQGNLDEVTLWLDQLSLSSELLNSFLEPYKAKVTGGNIILDKLYGKWPYVESMPDTLRGNGYWEGGNVNYLLSRRRESVSMDKVLFELININSVNQLKVTSALGVPYIDANINAQGDAELSVMPAVLEVINQPWEGDSNTPVFVMTDKVF